MSDELEKMRKSLYPPPEPQRKPSSAVPIVAFDFSEINSQLKKLVAERQRTSDLLSIFTQIDLDIKTLAGKTDVNLKQTTKILNQLDRRLKAVDSLEAKWNLLMQRVNGVLDELERALKQL